ncbi:MAG: Uma2 family endonuclease [Cyanobacteria bacterium J06623_4]
MVSQPATSVRWSMRDLEVLPQNEWTTYEIIDGELFVTRSPHRKHQQLAGRLFSVLDGWSQQSGAGEAIFSPGIILSEADNVIPDVVWVSREKLAVLEDEAGHLTGLPEIVVEVLSPGSDNIRRDRQAKLKLYSIQGAQEYWIVDRFSQQVEVYRREEAQLSLVSTLCANDTLTSPLLPDFSCVIGQLFG